MRKIAILSICLGLLCALNFTIAESADVPSPPMPGVFWGTAILDGANVSEGDLITAYDPDDVFCGNFTVNTDGYYGYFGVKGDNLNTTPVDEGATEGDTVTFYVNGAEAGSGVWNEGEIKEVDLSGVSLQDYDVDLVVGWNLISIPLELEDPTIEVVLSDLTTPLQVFAYNASEPDPLNRWTSYDSEAPFPWMNTLTEMNAGRAYWLSASAIETLTVTGALPEPKDINIYSSWNFVGYNWNTMDTLDAISPLTTPTQIFAYNASEPDSLKRWTSYDSEAPFPWMNTLQVMSAGRGYWLHSEDEEVWSIT